MFIQIKYYGKCVCHLDRLTFLGYQWSFSSIILMLPKTSVWHLILFILFCSILHMASIPRSILISVVCNFWTVQSVTVLAFAHFVSTGKTHRLNNFIFSQRSMLIFRIILFFTETRHWFFVLLLISFMIPISNIACPKRTYHRVLPQFHSCWCVSCFLETAL